MNIVVETGLSASCFIIQHAAALHLSFRSDEESIMATCNVRFVEKPLLSLLENSCTRKNVLSFPQNMIICLGQRKIIAVKALFFIDFAQILECSSDSCQYQKTSFFIVFHESKNTENHENQPRFRYNYILVIINLLFLSDQFQKRFKEHVICLIISSFFAIDHNRGFTYHQICYLRKVCN